MPEESCVDFLQWYLPRAGLRWPGYRRVHRLVCKRLRRRLATLGLADFVAYRALLDRAPEEWAQIDAMCRIPISRFYRDRLVFDTIGASVLPEAAATARAAGAASVRCWSAGCAAGEEPVTVLLIWHFLLAGTHPDLRLEILATDADEAAITRATTACYSASALKELPAAWIAQAFCREGELFCLLPAFRGRIDFGLADIRREMPAGRFHLILCRNLAFTYFDEASQRRILAELVARLEPGGFLVLGMHERLPEGAAAPLVRLAPNLPIYRKPALPQIRSATAA